MSRPLSIDFVAPPFAGHLFPLLQLARSLEGDEQFAIRVLSTESALKYIEASGHESLELLPGRDSVVANIADTSRRVGSNPFRLIHQLRLNLSLMGDMRQELLDHWSARRPDLVVADFVVPIAGLTAQQLGIEWWTSMPTPCVLETGDGIPSYLGGWAPKRGVYGRCRDAFGRLVIKTFKIAVHRAFRRTFRKLGVPSVYRDDGLERVYSPKKILGFGIREFEFERTWPDHFEFIGPLTKSPPFATTPLTFEPGKKHVLVTLGTHLPWARPKAVELIHRVAEQMPDCVFHFTRGEPGSVACQQAANVINVGYLPYAEVLDHYDAAIIHGGTGITYSCIEKAVPMLVWPHDYDQFDHAARVTHRGLGLTLQPHPTAVKRDLERLLHDSAATRELPRFQGLVAGTTPEARFRKLVGQLK